MKHKKERIECARRQAERVFDLATRDRKEKNLDELRREVGERAVQIARPLGVNLYDAVLVRVAPEVLSRAGLNCAFHSNEINARALHSTIQHVT